MYKKLLLSLMIMPLAMQAMEDPKRTFTTSPTIPHLGIDIPSLPFAIYPEVLGVKRSDHKQYFRELRQLEKRVMLYLKNDCEAIVASNLIDQRDNTHAKLLATLELLQICTKSPALATKMISKPDYETMLLNKTKKMSKTNASLTNYTIDFTASSESGKALVNANKKLIEKICRAPVTTDTFSMLLSQAQYSATTLQQEGKNIATLPPAERHIIQEKNKSQIDSLYNSLCNNNKTIEEFSLLYFMKYKIDYLEQCQNFANKLKEFAQMRPRKSIDTSKYSPSLKRWMNDHENQEIFCNRFLVGQLEDTFHNEIIYAHEAILNEIECTILEMHYQEELEAQRITTALKIKKKKKKKKPKNKPIATLQRVHSNETTFDTEEIVDEETPSTASNIATTLAQLMISAKTQTTDENPQESIKPSDINASLSSSPSSSSSLATVKQPQPLSLLDIPYSDGSLIKNEKEKNIIIQDTCNNMCIILDPQAKYIPKDPCPCIQYKSNVTAWFTDPQKTVADRQNLSVNDPRFIPNIPKAVDRLLRVHRFSKLIDTLLPEMGFQLHTHDRRDGCKIPRIIIPGTVEFLDTKEKHPCIFEYIMDKDGQCFHRNMRIMPQAQIDRLLAQADKQ